MSGPLVTTVRLLLKTDGNVRIVWPHWPSRVLDRFSMLCDLSTMHFLQAYSGQFGGDFCAVIFRSFAPRSLQKIAWRILLGKVQCFASGVWGRVSQRFVVQSEIDRSRNSRLASQLCIMFLKSPVPFEKPSYP